MKIGGKGRKSRPCSLGGYNLTIRDYTKLTFFSFCTLDECNMITVAVALYLHWSIHLPPPLSVGGGGGGLPYEKAEDALFAPSPSLSIR